MKKIIAILCFALMAVMVTNVSAQQVNVGIEVTKKIHKDSKKAETESAIVSHDVLKDGKVVIAAGTPVILDITYEKHRGLGKPGSINVKPVSTLDVNGQVVPLVGDAKSDTGKNKRGAAIGCGVTFGIILCPVGLLFLCIKGGNAAIPAGSQMIAVATLN